ncbi:PepSY domain-containing protein [Actinomycetaceae bacterium L2_0104]
MKPSQFSTWGRIAGTAALGAAFALAGCSGDASDPVSPQASVSSTASPATTPSPSTPAPSSSEPSSAQPSGNAEGPGRDADLATTTFDVQWQDAVDIAMERFDGQLTEVKLDWERDEWAYAVELVSDTEEYDIKISAVSEEVLREDTEPLDGDDAAEAQEDIFDPSTVVDLQGAQTAALGAVDGRIVEWVLEGDERGVFFEFEILSNDGGDDTDVRVDATNGEVVEVD